MKKVLIGLWVVLSIALTAFVETLGEKFAEDGYFFAKCEITQCEITHDP
jgi:hypothetical protein